MITTPTEFKEAIALMQRKGLLPTTLSSAQISQLSAALRRRATFSARLNAAGPLQKLRDLATLIAGGRTDQYGRLISVAEGKAQLKEAMVKAGVRPAPQGTRPINDFYSDTRRSLMIETTVLDTMGAGRHIAMQNEGALFSTPGWELVRFIVPKGGEAAERDWNQRWKDALDSIGSDAESGCTDGDEAGGRMVALKNHPIWQALGDGAGGYDDALGNPWAPFAFNSGMNTIDVDRDDCLDLGILDENQVIPPDHSLDLNDGLEASMAGFDKAMQDELVGGGLKIVKGILKMANREKIIRVRFGALAQRLREAA